MLIHFNIITYLYIYVNVNVVVYSLFFHAQTTLHHLHQAHRHPCHTSILSQLPGEHTTPATVAHGVNHSQLAFTASPVPI